MTAVGAQSVVGQGRGGAGVSWPVSRRRLHGLAASAGTAVARGRGPTLYPAACSPQAWAAATPFSLVQASLGLEFDAAKNEIRLRNPRLPSFIDEMTIRNLSLAAATIDLALQRHGDEVSVRVIRRKGEVQVSALYR